MATPPAPAAPKGPHLAAEAPLPPPPVVRAAAEPAGAAADLDIESEAAARGALADAAAAAAAGAARCSLGDKITAFDLERVEDRKGKFRAVVWLFKRVLLVGVVVDVVGIVSRRWLGDHVSGVLVAVGLVLIICSLLIGSACPFDLLDFNKSCERMPKTISGIWLALAILALLQVQHFPHLDAVKALINLGAATAPWRRFLPKQWPLYTTFVSLYLTFDPISWGFIFLFPRRNDFLQMQEPASYAIGALNLLAGALSGGLWLRRQWQIKRGVNTDVTGPCMAGFEAFYWYAGTAGVRFTAVGAAWLLLPRPGFADVVGAAIELSKGICIFLPVVTALLLGRYRLFHMLGKHFDHDGARRKRDGAFVSELLESVPVQVGQTWWVHRESADHRYLDGSDPRRYWQEGRVVEISKAGGEFLVEIPKHDDLATPMQGVERVRLPLPSGGDATSTEDFLLRAHEGLRCVEFESMTPELMQRVDARNNPALQAEWFSLSRPVRPGERVDFFLSNSWYDNAELKWDALVEVAGTFHKRRGRYPTFWLDKLCIPQSSITDGLRCLPVNVMACDTLLALCGNTYLSRLWCIWELFTLFAFVTEEAALERLQFVFLGKRDEGLRMLESMENFHVKNSHCYDPNEEMRLLQVIAAVGMDHFNGRIASMARQARKRIERQQPTLVSKASWVPTMAKQMSSRTERTPSVQSACPTVLP